jgi:Protein of unknown function (DUF3124)
MLQDTEAFLGLRSVSKRDGGCQLCRSRPLSAGWRLRLLGSSKVVRGERLKRPGIPAWLGIAAVSLAACAPAPAPPNPVSLGSAASRLKALASPVPADFVHRRVYVSVYSSIYLGLESEPLMVNLAATVSVRNVSDTHPLILTHARYYDSAGKAVRDYVTDPGELGPMATVEYVVKRDDTAGGPGANFVIEWAGPKDMDEPIVEAVMIGQSGHAGFSFISLGKTIQRPPN